MPNYGKFNLPDETAIAIMAQLRLAT